jgi:hypothetical protein
MQSVLLLLPPQKTVRGAFTWKIWAAVQEITGRSGQTVAGSGRLLTGPVNRLMIICVARQYSPRYIIQNRKAICRARFHLGMAGWGWTGSVRGCGIV